MKQLHAMLVNDKDSSGFYKESASQQQRLDADEEIEDPDDEDEPIEGGKNSINDKLKMPLDDPLSGMSDELRERLKELLSGLEDTIRREKSKSKKSASPTNTEKVSSLLEDVKTKLDSSEDLSLDEAALLSRSSSAGAPLAV